MVTLPRALGPGSLLGIVSPASAANPEKVHVGMRTLEALGYRTRLLPHALDRGPLYYAGALEHRLADLHAAFADPSIDAVLCTRGGWGTAELLPHLDRALLAANPKPLLGYSDLTSLHLWLLNELDLVSFQAPMVAADWANAALPDLASWTAALTCSVPWSLTAADGLRTLRPGTAEGMLTGGCLSIYAEALGTPYAPRNRGGVLFLEDIGTKPYQWDRMLVHLDQAGMLAGVGGIVFGDMSACNGAEDIAHIEASILHALRDFLGPVALGLRSGHLSQGNITLPFGVQVRLTCDENPRMDFLSPAVRE